MPTLQSVMMTEEEMIEGEEGAILETDITAKNPQEGMIMTEIDLEGIEEDHLKTEVEAGKEVKSIEGMIAETEDIADHQGIDLQGKEARRIEEMTVIKEMIMIDSIRIAMKIRMIVMVIRSMNRRLRLKPG